MPTIATALLAAVRGQRWTAMTGVPKAFKTTDWSAWAKRLGIVSAVLLFAAWLTSHTLEKRARDAETTVDQLYRSADEYRRYREFLSYLKSIQRDTMALRGTPDEETTYQQAAEVWLDRPESPPPTVRDYYDAWNRLTDFQPTNSSILLDFELADFEEFAGTISSITQDSTGQLLVRIVVFNEAKDLHGLDKPLDWIKTVRKQLKQISDANINDVCPAFGPSPDKKDKVRDWLNRRRERNRQRDSIAANIERGGLVLTHVATDLAKSQRMKMDFYRKWADDLEEVAWVFFAIGTSMAIISQVLERIHRPKSVRTRRKAASRWNPSARFRSGR